VIVPPQPGGARSAAGPFARTSGMARATQWRGRMAALGGCPVGMGEAGMVAHPW
jgi:hypothetical protein